MVVETNWYGKKITCPPPLGLDFILVPSANRANVVYRDLHVCHGGYFEVLFAFVVGLVSLSLKKCAISLQKNIFTLPINITSSENGSGNCFRQKIRANFDTGRAVRLPCAYIIHGSVVKSKTA